MEAILSGPAGLGLVMEGVKAWLIHWDQPGELVATTLAHASSLFRGREGDLRRFTVNRPEDALPLLALLNRQALTLHLVFSALEVELDEGFRREVSQDIEPLLQEKPVWDYVAGMLYSQPLPKPDPCPAAIHTALQVQATGLASLLEKVASSQAEIGQAKIAWNILADDLFPPAVGRPYYLQTVVESGLFYEFVQAMQNGRSDTFQFRASKVLLELPNHRQIVHAWAARLPHTHRKHKALAAEPKELIKPHGKQRTHSFDRGDVFAKVNQIKKKIIAAFNTRPLPENELARQLDWLRDLQYRPEDRSYLAKSLTDLAVRAKEANLPTYHLRLAREAVEVHETDGWAWAVLAAAYRLQGRLPEAWDASQRAMEFGDSP